MEEITIPDGMIFVMGDNRSRAADSVLFGPLPSENVLGKIIGMVETPSGPKPTKKDT
ncbi:MAG: S26 family signal peptidase [Bacillota bacterium]